MTSSRVDYYRQFAGESALESYKGLVSHSLPGLHGFVVDQLKRHEALASGALTVDLGAGQGALSMRLADSGCTVVACDYVESNFAAHRYGIEFMRLDLNTDFAQHFLPRKADCICAVEIAEHIENPRHFLRQCHALLREGGTIALTTPNIDSPRSKVDFVVEGFFHMFRETSYRSSGHITPITGWQLQKMAIEAGLEVVEHTTFGIEDYAFRERPKAYVLQELIRRFGTRCTWGDGAIHVTLLRKGRGG